ncbi:MAG: PQQ-dependent sugar dehydrogenase [Robiginitomaculum sp.]|nr:PQQ-dependent sugar dehydrogenase [Robiginitomaculum sp.]
MRNIKWLAGILIGLALIAVFAFARGPASIKQTKADFKDSGATYAKLCADCHGADLGGGLGSNLVDGVWEISKTTPEIEKIIADGNDEAGMPAFSDQLSSGQIKNLVQFIHQQKPVQTIKAVVNVDSIEGGVVKSEVWVDGLDAPWGLVFIGPNRALITEKPGQLRQVVDGKLLPEPITGTPEVFSGGQGGLLDVAIDPDYAENSWIYLVYSHPLEPGSDKSMTKLIRGKIVENKWVQEQVLFAAKPEHYIKSRAHFGSRITFDDKGHLFFGVGDRGRQDVAQDLTRPYGKIFRLKRDGRIPKDNPFLGYSKAYPATFSYGNRNPQGLVWSDGVLWETEHGPKGGDELNVITPGTNYGWPVISYGRNYSGSELTPYTHMDGMEQPVSQWTPSIAVSGLDVVTGDMFKDWNGYLLAGALKFKELRLIKVDGSKYISEQILIKDKGRVRDVGMGPDGAIYVTLNSPGQILRLTPNNKKEDK